MGRIDHIIIYNSVDKSPQLELAKKDLEFEKKVTGSVLSAIFAISVIAMIVSAHSLGVSDPKCPNPLAVIGITLSTMTVMGTAGATMCAAAYFFVRPRYEDSNTAQGILLDLANKDLMQVRREYDLDKLNRYGYIDAKQKWALENIKKEQSEAIQIQYFRAKEDLC